MSQHQRMFQSIVINLEEQNKEMMSRLKQDGASGGGEGMQMQLNRLKSLMENIFSSGRGDYAGAGGGGGEPPRAGPDSLCEPSMVESTPMPRQVEER